MLLILILLVELYKNIVYDIDIKNKLHKEREVNV